MMTAALWKIRDLKAAQGEYITKLKSIENFPNQVCDNENIVNTDIILFLSFAPEIVSFVFFLLFSFAQTKNNLFPLDNLYMKMKKFCLSSNRATLLYRFFFHLTLTHI